ncbi:MAG: hypothetical protein US57_C0008G0027 [Candidatus Moranbacteria bacterium GW2011_GWC2_37_73]|nr:MAG: hypothetical protein UR95_C0001G0085 [Parcubacteria group bacterium GW2011_GWC1_36_108]KKQ00101.1 MAG: hypothetical protein US09_C0021G0021 [Candidatus Moranbacteria bacterium GW2011_GWD1_36_198]KKQ00407.1 MAG: hypothetical protein US10_C0032G0004 [Candidatus Moranbacteria bacterium GW2011_GWD2_36_198]KKQ39843.1 MAG: hypothetical protein US57_C0008G0027 [Candidatus Moranbacteria bacterium GW2011_GWC2_37_73]HAS00008.1 hypothetical protein [Candidatus Moranbacteria bacterium]
MSRKYIKNCTGNDCEEEKKSSRFFSVFIFYTLLVCFIGVTGYVVFFSQHLQIVNITVLGTKELNGQEIQQIVSDSLQGKYLGIIPRNNFLFVSQRKFENLLNDKFKKIRTLSVIKKFPDTVSIEIDERKALLVWCSSEKCYLLDENGTAYSEADFSSPDLMGNNLLQINETNRRDVTIGDKIIEPSYEQYALAIKDSLAALGFEATGQYFTPSRMAEEINVKTNQETEFYFSTQFSLDSAIRTLETVLKKEIPEDKKGEIAYIDLRNENKVFYKFKNTDPPVDENPQAENVEVK